MSNDIFAGFNRGPADPDKITMDTFSSDDNNSRRSKRYSRFGDALKAAAAYKEKAKAEKEAGVEMGDEDDDKGTRGFKISPDATVIEGYRSPPFRVDAPQGGGILGPIGGALSTFFPVTGGIVSSIGGLTGY
jgi:hypothetical protein